MKKTGMDIQALIAKAEQSLTKQFQEIDDNELLCTQRVLDSFKRHQVACRHFAPTTGYGYDDVGRDTLERIYADIFDAEQAIVRPHITSGTHALSVALFGLLLPGDHLLSATEKPYDTMLEVIGIEGNAPGSLKEMGVSYSDVSMTAEGTIDVEAVLHAMQPTTKVVLIQRSRGYAWRASVLPKDMAATIKAVKEKNPDVFIMVDNCYGGFVTNDEPTQYGADVVVGSLIKNMGGGLAPTGGYLAGTARAIERIEARLTAPGIGREVGSYAGSYRLFYQGLFNAPHAVAQALKTSVLASKVFELLGMKTTPACDAVRADIIQAIELASPERVIAFCRGIQSASPVDSFAMPEPWGMPGYQDQVIMAAGTFVSGASIELSADAPIRPPYNVYLQGGLTYAHGKLGLIKALECIFELDETV